VESIYRRACFYVSLTKRSKGGAGGSEIVITESQAVILDFYHSWEIYTVAQKRCETFTENGDGLTVICIGLIKLQELFCINCSIIGLFKIFVI